MTINTETKRIFPVDSADPFTDDDVERYRIAGPKILDALAEHIRVLCLTASDIDACLNTETVANEVISTLLHKFHFDDVRAIALDPYASLMPVVELIQTAANLRGYPAFAKGDNVVTDAICDHWHHIGELMVQRAKSLYATVEGTAGEPGTVDLAPKRDDRFDTPVKVLQHAEKMMRSGAVYTAALNKIATVINVEHTNSQLTKLTAVIEYIKTYSYQLTVPADINAVDELLMAAIALVRHELTAIETVARCQTQINQNGTEGLYRDERRDDYRKDSGRSRDERYHRRDRGGRAAPSEEALEIVRDILMNYADEIDAKLPRRR